jgi:hypothetical protein
MLLAVVAVGVGSTAASATAQSHGSGGGQSHHNAAFGFNVKADLRGSFNYVGVTMFPVTINGIDIPVGSSFHGHCHGYTKVLWVSPQAVHMQAACRGFFFVNGGPPIRDTVYLQAHMIDNGEPGTNDRACIDWGTSPGPRPTRPGLFVEDCGVIHAGNIQVKET